MRSSVQQRVNPPNINDSKHALIKLQQLNLNRPVPETKIKYSFQYGIKNN